MAETTNDRLGRIETSMVRLEGAVNTHNAKVDAAFDKMTAAIDFGDRRNEERLTATRDALHAEIESLRVSVSANSQRLDESDERIRSNFRLVISALVFPLIVLIVGSILVYGVVGAPK